MLCAANIPTMLSSAIIELALQQQDHFEQRNWQMTRDKT
jgi:hypothetical protein